MAGGVGIFIVAGPGIEGWILQGASKREGDGPREGAVFLYCGEAIGSLFDSLAARKKDYASQLGRDVVFKNFGSFLPNFFWDGRSFVILASDDHIDIKKASP